MATARVMTVCKSLAKVLVPLKPGVELLLLVELVAISVLNEMAGTGPIQQDPAPAGLEVMI
jgi:hypothetical protein